MIRSLLVAILAFAATAPYMEAQQGWIREGALRRWQGEAITSSILGCQPPPGDPIVEIGGSLMEVNLQDGTTIKKTKPAGNWKFLARQPRMMVLHGHGDDGQGNTTVAFYDTWKGEEVASLDEPTNTEGHTLDVYRSWIDAEGSKGCLVFGPLASTPDDQKTYVVMFFSSGVATYTLRVKQKVDVDIYVRPDTEKGTLCYVRGNGISFPPSTEEVFTNASYLVYQSDGTREQLPLPARGPGSGKGRKIIWHSNKWDRLLFTDEFASGAMLIKASNGIVVDSITQVSIDPGDVKILSASGNINDRWMTTHATVGSKNVLILWAMPETVETEIVGFDASDAAIKQMPLAPWSIVVPFISSVGGTNTLYSWDPQDVVSVDEEMNATTNVWPNPATDIVNITLDAASTSCHYVIVNAAGDVVGSHHDEGCTDNIAVDVSGLPSGNYHVVITNDAGRQSFASFAVQR
jgi:hypothetical protein